MAITRTQIAKQLLEQGGRAGFQGGGADMGKERGSETGRAPGPVGGGGGGRDPMKQFDFTPEDPGPAKKALSKTTGLGDLLGVGKVPFIQAQVLNKILNKKQLTQNQINRQRMIENLRSLEEEEDLTVGGDGPSIFLPELPTQAPSIVEQEPEVEEEEGPFELSRRYRAEGGIMNTDVVGGEFDFESARQMYGLGKLVKKVTRSVKKIAKSPIGKAALLGVGAFGLPGGAFGIKGFLPQAFKTGASNFLFGLPGGNKLVDPTKGLFGVGGKLALGKGKLGIGALIGGTSLIAGALTAQQEEEAQQISDETGIDIAEIRANPNKYLARRFRAEGGSMDEPVAKKTMPLLDMGGKEMDLRAEGGFVPIGRMEKADDVPARLSKNEFVFTADAVRNAGEGDVDKGAEVMYNMMKNLESGGDVSEESQGLDGARKMFQTSQRLEEVL